MLRSWHEGQGDMAVDFWTWLGKLPAGSASFLGTIAGSSLGLIAVVIGALFNAHLNRNRDDAVREAERRSVVAALSAELTLIQESLDRSATDARKERQNDGGFFVHDVAHLIRVLPLMIPKIGLLQPETIRPVIEAYSLMEQLCEDLIMVGGKLHADAMPQHRRLIDMPAQQAVFFAKLCAARSKPLQEALIALRKDRGNKMH